MNIKYHKEFENLYEGLEYYRIFDDQDPIVDGGGTKYPNMTLNNMSSKWELTIFHKNTNYQEIIQLGKADDWPFDKLKPVLDVFIQSYRTMTRSKQYADGITT